MTVAFAEIDWYDYHIVQTIEFTAADATSDLPPPMSIAEVENMTLAQKRMAAQIMEATAPDVEAYRAANAQVEEVHSQEAPAANGTAAPGATAEDEEIRERKRKEAEERERETARAREMQNSANVPMKIRKDYVPKSKLHRSLYACCTNRNIASSRGQGGIETNHDNMYDLRATSRRGRACRTQTYRAVGSQVEDAARQPRDATCASERTSTRQVSTLGE
jgi:hypothetical protein